MFFRSPPRLAFLWTVLALWLGLLGLPGLLAHEPFDSSARVELRAEDTELTATFGADAARAILSLAGYSEAKIADLLIPRGPRGHQTLPTEIASRFFAVRDGDRLLAAHSATLLQEGMEVIFAFRYPALATEALDVRTLYFDTIPEMRHGSLAAINANGFPLGGVLVNRDSPSARFQRTHPPTTPTATTHVAPSPADTDTATATPDAPPAPRPSPTDTPDSGPVVVTSPRPAFGAFLHLGVEHILIGFDHLLFLGALLIGVRSLRTMLAIITCFTVGHSITLALAALDLVTLSPRIVEPLIAASIIVVCIENIFRKDVPADRLWLAGGFGLIHGFGFAGVLRETGLASADGGVAVPLFAFNLGVELGQLAVAALLLPLLFLLRRWRAFELHGSFATSIIVIGISACWLLERTVLAD